MTIDMRSDTVTRPTPAMRRAMAEAEVGDDVLDGDPTVRRLEARVAELLGKEAGLFFPSGTMGNQAAIWALATPGTEILLDAASHIVEREAGAASALRGVQIRPVVGTPVMRAAELERAMRASAASRLRASLVCLENTHNSAGGKITSLDETRALAELAHGRSIPVHLDGARLWNVAVATGLSLEDFAGDADTVMVSFTKGLGAPVGAALAGDASVIEAARDARERFGGAMRQSGVLAAAALHGIDAHWPGLAEDHRRAAELAATVDGAGGARVVRPDTNIVMIDLPDGIDAPAGARAAAARGVLVSVWTESRLRAVTHLDVDDAAVRRAAEVLVAVLEEAGPAEAARPARSAARRTAEALNRG